MNKILAIVLVLGNLDLVIFLFFFFFFKTNFAFFPFSNIPFSISQILHVQAPAPNAKADALLAIHRAVGTRLEHLRKLTARLAGLPTIPTVRKMERLIQLRDSQKYREQLLEKYQKVSEQRMNAYFDNERHDMQHFDIILKDVRDNLFETESKIHTLTNTAQEYFVAEDQAIILNLFFDSYVQEISRIPHEARKIMTKSSKALNTATGSLANADKIKGAAENVLTKIEKQFEIFLKAMNSMIESKRFLVNGEAEPQDDAKIEPTVTALLDDDNHDAVAQQILDMKTPYVQALDLLDEVLGGSSSSRSGSESGR